MRSGFALVALALSTVGLAQSPPREASAFTVVSKALAEANASNRNVWVLFHASW